MRSTSKTITLTNGKPLTLTLDFNAAADFEEATGESFFEAKNTATNVRARVWALARQTNPDITLHDVGALLGPGGEDFNTIMNGIKELSSTNEPPTGGRAGAKGK